MRQAWGLTSQGGHKPQEAVCWAMWFPFFVELACQSLCYFTSHVSLYWSETYQAEKISGRHTCRTALMLRDDFWRFTGSEAVKWNKGGERP